MVLDPQRWWELRRFRGLVESGAMSVSEVAKETGLNWRTVSKYLSADSGAPPRRTASGQPRKRVVDEVAPNGDRCSVTKSSPQRSSTASCTTAKPSPSMAPATG